MRVPTKRQKSVIVTLDRQLEQYEEDEQLEKLVDLLKHVPFFNKKLGDEPVDS